MILATIVLTGLALWVVVAVACAAAYKAGWLDMRLLVTLLIVAVIVWVVLSRTA